MRKHTILALLFFLCNSHHICAQDYTVVIQEQAKKVVDALVNGNLNYMVDQTYPDMISLIGGKEKMLTILQTQMDIYFKKEILFESIEVGTPSPVVQAEEELHALVPQKIVLQVDGGKLISEGYLLAISKNNGEHWYFLDTAQLTNDNIQKMLPHFNPELSIPEKTAARFVKN